jgi:hypothetical protein
MAEKKTAEKVEKISEYGMKLNIKGDPMGGPICLPRSLHLLDNLEINAEHMVKRTTVGGAFDIVWGMFMNWTTGLSRAILCWTFAIIFLSRDIVILGIIAALLGAYYYGIYKIWYSRYRGRLGFAAMVPLV